MNRDSQKEYTHRNFEVYSEEDDGTPRVPGGSGTGPTSSRVSSPTRRWTYRQVLFEQVGRRWGPVCENEHLES